MSLYNQLPTLLDQPSHSFHDPFESHHLHVLPATDLHQIMLPAHPSTAHAPPNASEQHPPQTRRSRGCSAHSKGLRTKCPGGKKQKGNEDERVHQEMIIKTHENPTTEYIHVRARRGQATDSHSLAERVRREKISERMRTLQGLLPGCDKVTGKALMLDQIISYIQSLQSQVQYLSMKLASVSPIHDTETGHDQTMKQPDICNQRDNTTHPTMAVTASTFTETNSYDHHLESSNLLQQVQRLFCQDGFDGVVSWDVDDIQTVIDFNSSELSNTLCNPY